MVQMRERMAQLVNLSETPTVLLHGNPHLNNYSLIDDNACMNDFDRTAIGPYSWDLARFLVSLSLKSDNDAYGFIKPGIISRLFEGYEWGLLRFNSKFIQVQNKSAFEQEIDSTFFDKRMKELRKNSIDVNNQILQRLIALYIIELKEDILKDYDLISAGKLSTWARGRDRYMALFVKKRKSAYDIREEQNLDLIIDFKPAVVDPEDKYFKNAFKPTEAGKKMIVASQIYCPGMGKREAAFTMDGVGWWGRELPRYNRKLRGEISEEIQRELAFSVGSQLGRGHALSISLQLQKGTTIEISSIF